MLSRIMFLNDVKIKDFIPNILSIIAYVSAVLNNNNLLTIAKNI